MGKKVERERQTILRARVAEGEDGDAVPHREGEGDDGRGRAAPAAPVYHRRRRGPGRRGRRLHAASPSRCFFPIN